MECHDFFFFIENELNIFFLNDPKESRKTKTNKTVSTPHAMEPRYTSLAYIIREYGSTLYVGLARAVSPTNTNFRLAFLLTRLQEALYEDLVV